jgi:hypothetical protein
MIIPYYRSSASEMIQSIVEHDSHHDPSISRRFAGRPSLITDFVAHSLLPFEL